MYKRFKNLNEVSKKCQYFFPTPKPPKVEIISMELKKIYEFFWISDSTFLILFLLVSQILKFLGQTVILQYRFYKRSAWFEQRTNSTFADLSLNSYYKSTVWPRNLKERKKPEFESGVEKNFFDRDRHYFHFGGLGSSQKFFFSLLSVSFWKKSKSTGNLTIQILQKHGSEKDQIQRKIHTTRLPCDLETWNFTDL